MYCRTGPVNIPATLKLVMVPRMSIVIFPSADTPSRVARESGSNTVWLLLRVGRILVAGRGVDELIVYDLWEYIGSTASTPTDVLLPRGPKAFRPPGEEAGSEWGRCQDCGRLVRLLVKLIGRSGLRPGLCQRPALPVSLGRARFGPRPEFLPA